MKPHNVLKFWFYRAKLMVAGPPESKEKSTQIQISEQLTLELHPASDSESRPFLRLSRRVDQEEQAINLYLKEVPPLIEALPRAVAQLLALATELPVNQLRTFRQLEILKNKSELADLKEYSSQ
jgi:hypothetical protein